nr:MAG TPA: hypothetical protein [Caudoviricetes sp.]
MGILNKDKSKNTKQPENTTKPKKTDSKITAVQWVKNSGHSLKGVFLEWLSEQQLFSIVGGEIKAVKKEMKKKKLSPKEKKTLKQKLADLSEGAIIKFGKEYLGKDSPEETKEYVKEGLSTIMKQVKTGNFYVKENLFGDDEEMEDFMEQLEDEWDDEDESPSGESFSYEDLVAKYSRGFGEFMSSGKKIIEPEAPKQEWDDQFLDVDDKISVGLYYKKETEGSKRKLIRESILDKVDDIQKHTLSELKIKDYEEMYIYYREDDDFLEVKIETDDGNGYTRIEIPLSKLGITSSNESYYSFEITELTTAEETYNENEKLYNLRKNIFD